MFHVCGAAAGLHGDAALTDGDWLRLAGAWQSRRPRKLGRLFEDRDLLIVGGGHPRGFVEFWVETARQLNCRSVWVAASAIEGDAAALLRWLDDGRDSEFVCFDDGGGPAFLREVVRRWAMHSAAPIPPTAARDEALRAPDEAREASVPSMTSEPRTPAPSRSPELHHERPWPGLTAYDESHAAYSYGRESEVAELMLALRSHPLTVLAGRSGMGKTSLLRAGLGPVLRSLRLIPVWVRLGWTEPMSEQILAAVADAAASAGLRLPGPQAGESLWSFFHRKDVVSASASGGPAAAQPAGARPRFVIIFDQFEEIFVVPGASASGQQWARAGWRDLADLVEGWVPPDLRERCYGDPGLAARYDFRASVPAVLLALREDFMSQLMALSSEMPSVGRSIVRVGGLRPEAALRAIHFAGAVSFTDEAARAVVECLQRDRDAVAGHSPFEAADINPAFLGMMCFRLNEERLARGAPMVDVALVQARQDDLLDGFYEEAFRGLEATARRWVEDELVTPRGHRASVDLDSTHDSLRSRGVAPGALEQLVERRLLRLVDDGRGPKVELAHDLLNHAARKSREARPPDRAPDKGSLSRLLDRLGRSSGDKT